VPKTTLSNNSAKACLMQGLVAGHIRTSRLGQLLHGDLRMRKPMLPSWAHTS